MTNASKETRRGQVSRWLACALLVAACGEDNQGTGAGEPLIASTLTGEFNGAPFTPIYGVGKATGSSFGLEFGTEDVSCDGPPRSGTYAAISVPAPVAVGVYQVFVNLIQVVDSDLDAKGALGEIQITAVSDTEVSAMLDYSAMVDGGSYGLTGAVTVLRCD